MNANTDFDLAGFLLGEIYPNMSINEISHWSLEDAENLVSDLNIDGIEADPSEVFELIVEFIEQDTDTSEVE